MTVIRTRSEWRVTTAHLRYAIDTPFRQLNVKDTAIEAANHIPPPE